MRSFWHASPQRGVEKLDCTTSTSRPKLRITVSRSSYRSLTGTISKRNDGSNSCTPVHIESV